MPLGATFYFELAQDTITVSGERKFSGTITAFSSATFVSTVAVNQQLLATKTSTWSVRSSSGIESLGPGHFVGTLTADDQLFATKTATWSVTSSSGITLINGCIHIPGLTHDLCNDADIVAMAGASSSGSSSSGIVDPISILGDGSDGDLTLTNSTTTLSVCHKMYGNITISSTSVLTSSCNLLVLRATGTVSVSGRIHQDFLGAYGGAGSGSPTAGSNGTAWIKYNLNTSTGGAGAGTGDSTAAGAYNADVISMLLGWAHNEPPFYCTGGGGGGGDNTTPTGGGAAGGAGFWGCGGGGGGGGFCSGCGAGTATNGGRGGGALIIFASTVTIASGAKISASGAHAATASNATGGGGGGGMVWIEAKNYSNSGTLEASGGSGSDHNVGGACTLNGKPTTGSAGSCGWCGGGGTGGLCVVLKMHANAQ